MMDRHSTSPQIVLKLVILFVISSLVVGCLPDPMIESLGIVIDPTRRPTASQPIPSSNTPQPTELSLETLAPTPKTPTLKFFNQRRAMRDSFQSDIDLFPDATSYVIDAAIDLDPDSNSAGIEGITRIQFTNQTDESLEDFVVMTWPNDRQYAAEMEVGPAFVDGALLTPEEAMEGIAVRYELPAPLAPGERIDVSIPFSVQAGGPIGETNPRRFGISRGVFFAPTFYPLVPRIEADGWQLDPAPPGGDTTNSDVAFYDVSLRFDPEFSLVASGKEIGRRRDPEGIHVEYATGPVRDFAFALGSFLSDTRMVDGVEISVWVIEEHQKDISLVLDSASDQMRLLNQIIGPYPYNELDVVDVPGAFGGIEYPTLVTVGTLGSTNIIDPTVHEIAHQWFYGLIGNDQINEPWLDEAIATFAQILYYEDQGSSSRASGMLSSFRSILREHPEPGKPIGKPVGEYTSPGEYGLFVYLKGALFMERLRARMGDEQFYAFLNDYYQTYRYDFADSNEFLAVAESTCDCQLDDLFDLWVFEGGDLQLP